MFMKVPFFILVLGSVPLAALAEEASSVLEGEESATIDFRDRNDTEFEALPTLLPTRLHNVTNLLQFGHLMTTESAFVPDGDGDNSTGYGVNTESVDGEASGEPEKTEKGGLETIALVGIIIGIVVAVGILAGIVIAVVRKMSGPENS
ncbi:podoplanin isoform X2 [Manacus vitellinus]|uniref:podoplanin isoform X2 n=1 Tax=Manacus vitellinus TaxID=328815 RepID=UPI00084738B6|nr:podoplanin isoform X2 [Manacus vitellinus]XP_051642062.1 podoplanin isoform X2 [Manacus candei]